MRPRVRISSTVASGWMGRTGCESATLRNTGASPVDVARGGLDAECQRDDRWSIADYLRAEFVADALRWTMATPRRRRRARITAPDALVGLRLRFLGSHAGSATPETTRSRKPPSRPLQFEFVDGSRLPSRDNPPRRPSNRPSVPSNTRSPTRP